MTSKPHDDPQARLCALLSRLDRLLALSGPPAREVEISAGNRRFGKHLPQAALAAAGVVQLHRRLFAGKYTPERLLAKEARVRQLDSARVMVEELGRRIAAACSAARVDLAREVSDVLEVIDCTLKSPVVEPADRQALAQDARPLLSVREGRRGDIRAAMARTRRHQFDQAGREAEGEEQLSTLKTARHRLTLENRVLKGQPLRPEDLVPPAPGS